MLDVFICHSLADREIAAMIAARLERGAEAKVWLEEWGRNTARTVAVAWEGGLSSAAILLVLSRDAVPERLSRETWHSVLKHVEGNAAPPLGAVLAGDCPYPRLLERKNFFRWSDSPQEALRAIERWMVSLHQQRQGSYRSFRPAPLPWFDGRKRELDTLWRTLVDEPGAIALFNAAPGSGKTSLAQQFAREAGGHFRDILWIECGHRSPVFIAGDLASQLDGSMIGQHRLLVVFDDATMDLPAWASPPTFASVLITTRSGELRLPLHVGCMPIETTTPVATSPMSPVDPRLWQAIAVCRPQGFSLELAARIASMNEDESRAACERLVAGRWIDPLDAAGARFRLGAGSVDAARAGSELESLRRRHAEILNEIFSESSATRCQQFIADLEIAFSWALTADWSFATRLAERAFTFLNAQGRRAEALSIYTQLRQAAQERQDFQVAQNCSWELSWIQDETGEVRHPAAVRDQLAFDFK